MACSGGKTDVVNLLIRNNPLVCHDSVPSLMMACSNGNKDIVNILISHVSMESLGTVNADENNCVMLACEKGNIDVLIILLDKLLSFLHQVGCCQMLFTIRCSESLFCGC